MGLTITKVVLRVSLLAAHILFTVQAITRDNVQTVVDAVVYWQITAPLMPVYEVVVLIGSIFMPVETNSMLSSVGAMKEILSQAGEKTQFNELDV